MADVSEAYSEEKTEPYTDSQIESRFLSFRGANFEAAYNDTVPLDDLVVDDYHHQQGVRILVRPLTRSRSVSPGSDNCRLLALRAEVESAEEHKVLAVTQTWRDIKFSVRIPGDLHDAQPRPPIWCELYYDPTSDNQILVNRGDFPITIRRVSVSLDESPPSEQIIVPGHLRALTPGTWNISADSIPVLDFRILERRPLALTQTASESDLNALKGTSQNGSSKRSFSDGQLSPEKRAKTDNGAIMFMTPQPLVLPLPHASSANQQVAKKGDHPMIGMRRDETVSITGGCELEKYQLTKKTQLHSSKLSTVFTANHSHCSIPDNTITVKVLKTAVPQESRTWESERNVIRQADVWLRELETQLNLKHESIVRLYAGDARYLSLYMEHVDARDLTVKGVWRNAKGDMFLGTKQDAVRILRDIAGGLNYLHQKRLVHNDIKPANILYSPERGAVLCDFGLTTPNNPNERATNGGTPYYVPPEYIVGMQRGPPSDVWALGVTMLYVLRKIPFPDVRSAKGHPKQLYWHISDVNKPPPFPRDRTRRPPTAAEQMRQWLVEVGEAKDKLDTKNEIEALVADMLIINPRQRIEMKGGIARLAESKVLEE